MGALKIVVTRRNGKIESRFIRIVSRPDSFRPFWISQDEKMLSFGARHVQRTADLCTSAVISFKCFTFLFALAFSWFRTTGRSLSPRAVQGISQKADILPQIYLPPDCSPDNLCAFFNPDAALAPRNCVPTKHARKNWRTIQFHRKNLINYTTTVRKSTFPRHSARHIVPLQVMQFISLQL